MQRSPFEKKNVRHDFFFFKVINIILKIKSQFALLWLLINNNSNNNNKMVKRVKKSI